MCRPIYYTRCGIFSPFISKGPASPLVSCFILYLHHFLECHGLFYMDTLQLEVLHFTSLLPSSDFDDRSFGNECHACLTVNEAKIIQVLSHTLLCWVFHHAHIYERVISHSHLPKDVCGSSWSCLLKGASGMKPFDPVWSRNRYKQVTS